GLPDDDRAQFPGNPALDRFAADDGEASRRDACRLEAGRGRHYRRFGVRRRGQDDLPAGLESAKALYPDRATAEVTLVAVITGSSDEAIELRRRKGVLAPCPPSLHEVAARQHAGRALHAPPPMKASRKRR